MNFQCRKVRFALTLWSALALMASPVVSLRAQDQPKKYELKLAWKPVVGYKTGVSKSEKRAIKMVIQGEGRVVGFEENVSTELRATREVTRVEGDHATEWTWNISKATLKRGGKERSLVFEGKTIVVTLDEKGQHTLVYDNGEPVAPSAVKVLKDLIGVRDKKPGEPSAMAMFGPKKPIAVGESWSPDVALFAKGLAGSGLIAIDVSQSSASAVLKSVSTQNGADFGNIKVAMDISMDKIGPVQLDKPIDIDFMMDVEGCIDGKRPDYIMKGHAEAKGERVVEVTAEGESHKGDISLDMSFDSTEGVQTLE